MLKVVLTGGIGSGKSTVAERFAWHGVPVIDADLIARRLVEPEQPAYRDIIEAFGESVLNGEGKLDRTRLRSRVFGNQADRRLLESILHPRVYEAMEREVGTAAAPYVLLVVPLLVESGRLDLGDRILAVDLPEAEQIRRVCRRDGLAEAEAVAILNAQADRAARLAVADDVIDNSRDLASLLAQADQFHRMYRTMAHARRDGGE
jgi:dephospho-CoA kinase